MSYTYDPETPLGQVRLYIGDTDVTNAEWTDAELGVLLAQAGSNVYAAAALALLAWGAKLAREDQVVKVGVWTGDRGDVSKRMIAQAKAYLDAAVVVPKVTEGPWVVPIPLY